MGCLENSDLENLDPRPKKLRPSGCLENSDQKNKIYLHRMNAASRLVCCSSIQWQNPKSKNDHENYIQHSYRFFFSLSYKSSLYPRVVSLEAIREVCGMMVS